MVILSETVTVTNDWLHLTLCLYVLDNLRGRLVAELLRLMLPDQADQLISAEGQESAEAEGLKMRQTLIRPARGSDSKQVKKISLVVTKHDKAC